MIQYPSLSFATGDIARINRDDLAWLLWESWEWLLSCYRMMPDALTGLNICDLSCDCDFRKTF